MGRNLKALICYLLIAFTTPGFSAQIQIGTDILGESPGDQLRQSIAHTFVKPELVAFPKLTRDRISIQNESFSLVGTVRIINESGMVISEKKLKNSTLSLERLVDGLYFIELVNHPTISLLSILKMN